MNKERPQDHTPATARPRTELTSFSRCARLGLTTALGASLILCRDDGPQARQRARDPEVRVTGIAAGGRVVSITADGSLSRAQTWQDEEGFHVVLNNGQSELGGSARGVKVRRVGNSLELVVPVKRGASVTVQPRGSQLDLVMSGGEGAAEAALAAKESPEADAARRERAVAAGRSQNAARAEQPRAARPTAEQNAPRPSPHDPAKPHGAAGDAQPLAGGAPKAEGQGAAQAVAAGAGGAMPPMPEPRTQVAAAVTTDLQQSAASAGASDGASVSSVLFSLPALLVALCVALGGLALFVVGRRRRGAEGEVEEPVRVEAKPPAAARQESKKSERGAQKEVNATTPFEQEKGDRRRSTLSVPFERRRTGPGAEDEATRQKKTLGAEGAEGEQAEARRAAARAQSPAAPAVMFGAYRVEQEVGRLVQGRSHSVEVIASRAADDRRAVETSLLKALRAPETDEDGRLRARAALEDYGFVARSCASLLLGPESFDRASAAGALGEMRSAQALPFLTEALYDADSVVRAETVKSLGALGLPSAIGALLDTARRHPDLSTALLRPALTACSVESLGVAWGMGADARLFADFDEPEFCSGDVKEVAPAEEGYEELPDWTEDATLRESLERLTAEDSDVRLHCAQQLAQFQVRRAVEALNSLAVHDAEPAVRAAAVNSLGLINHESVFAPVLVAMADDAREVRAAAARALSRLGFDRAEAYVRVSKTADAESLVAVARACVDSGLAAQALDRLASEDPRQSHEAISLLSLVLGSGDSASVLDAVERHRDVDVRVASVRLLGMMNRPEFVEELRELAGRGGLHPRVRLAVMELQGEAVEQPQAV